MTDPITTQHLLLECVDMRGLDRAGEDPVAAVVEILSRLGRGGVEGVGCGVVVV
jgi:hypothetical protein